ncbi:MAG: hypothetical protein VB042_05325 [Victivallaceae bacterium]|nr:hypothetical protein [Victivallaceae bacterium]
MFDLLTLLTSTGGAISGGTLTGIIILMYIRHQLAGDRVERAELRAKVDRLETERLGKLERTLEEHLRIDNPAATDAKVAAVSNTTDAKIMALAGNVERLINKVDYLAGGVARLEKGAENTELYLDNLNKSISKVREELYHGR